jgi:hypothetical protein
MVAWGMWHGVAEGGVDIYIHIYIWENHEENMAMSK